MLRITKNDKALGLPIPAETAWTHWDNPVNVDQLRGERWWSGQKEPMETPELFGHVERIVIPTPAARARADEIVAAYDAWEAKAPRLTAEQQRAYDEAERRWKELSSALCRIEDHIAVIAARTLDGLMAKARVANAAVDGGGSDIPESLVNDLLALAAATPWRSFGANAGRSGWSKASGGEGRPVLAIAATEQNGLECSLNSDTHDLKLGQLLFTERRY